MTTNTIDEKFIAQCQNKFSKDPMNVVARNAITSIGSTIPCIDSERLNKVTHIFQHSVKKKNVKATNQGSSGRCWIFAGLNMYRHHIINALGLENFEYSETFVYFWDKFERSNSFLQWFIDNSGEFAPGDREFDYMLEGYMTDGGYWNFFASIVNKYGMVPKNCMKETFHSDYSGEMNVFIEELLKSAAYRIYNGQVTNPQTFKKQCLERIWNTLVKFLGEPPKDFEWAFTKEEDDMGGTLVPDLDPHKMSEMGLKVKDYIVLGNAPSEKMSYKKMYEIKYTSTVTGGQPCRILNLPIKELTKYALKSVQKGIPVWFAADVNHFFNPYNSTLDDKLIDRNHLLPMGSEELDKGESILFKNIEGNHAMTLVGVNVDSEGNPTEWQVENSWGYWDNETPGEDGFLTMSQSWFEKYVVQVVIHKDMLTRAMKRLVGRLKPIVIEPWEAGAPAFKVKGNINPPKSWTRGLNKKNNQQ